MFSRARIFVEDLKGKRIDNDPFLTKIAKPNFSQSQQDFLYSHEFFKGTGNNITRVIANKPNDIEAVFSLENLIPSQINYNNINKMKSFVFAPSDIEDVKQRSILYKIGDEDYPVPLNELVFFYDVTNGLTANSRFKSPSRIDALVPALANIHEAQKSKNINLRMSAKHIVSSGLTSGGDMLDGLQSGEKQDIENGFMHKDIMATESNLKVNSLANDFRKLMFDESANADLLKIANAYGISKDVLNWALDGAITYENQEAAVIKWIQNSIMFEGEDFAGTWESYFNYREQGKRIKLDYSHLPVMQVLKEKEVDSIKTRTEVAKALVELGMTNEAAMESMGLNNLKNG